MKKRRLIIIFSAILFVIAIGIGVYAGFNRSNQIVSTVPGRTTTGSFPISSGGSSQTSTDTFPTTSNTQGSYVEDDDPSAVFAAQKAALSQLTQKTAVGFWITDLGVLHYIDQQGTITQVLSGQESDIASSPFGSPVSVVSSPDGLWTAVLFASGTWGLFDGEGRAWVDMGNDIESAVFSPDSSQLAFLRRDTSGVAVLYTQSLTATKQTLIKVLSLSLRDVFLRWPSAKKIILLPRQSAAIASEQIWSIDLSSKTLSLLDSGKAIGATFSLADGSYMRFETDGGGSSVTVSAVGADGVGATMPFWSFEDKCVFAQLGTYALCGAPASQDVAIRLLPDDYLKGNVYFKDFIYKVSFDGGVRVGLVFSAADVALDTTQWRSWGDMFYFINRLDGRVYSFDWMSANGQ